MNRVDRVVVSSTSIASIGYEVRSGTLEIEFNNRRVYQYYAVPQSAYDALMAASSKGQFFVTQIKDRFFFDRVE